MDTMITRYQGMTRGVERDWNLLKKTAVSVEDLYALQSVTFAVVYTK